MGMAKQASGRQRFVLVARVAAPTRCGALADIGSARFLSHHHLHNLGCSQTKVFANEGVEDRDFHVLVPENCGSAFKKSSSGRPALTDVKI